MNHPKTKKVLLNKYTQAELRNKLPYGTVRAAAILAREVQPLPDPVALLAFLSCANIIFRRWRVHLYNYQRRTDDELPTTCYTESEVKGQKVMLVNTTAMRP